MADTEGVGDICKVHQYLERLRKLGTVCMEVEASNAVAPWAVTMPTKSAGWAIGDTLEEALLNYLNKLHSLLEETSNDWHKSRPSSVGD